MFQTWWDINKQNIRKIVDMGMGTLAGYSIFQGEWGPFLVAVAGIGINYAWFWLDNRNKVTVDGLEEAGRFNAAMDVKAVLDSKK